MTDANQAPRDGNYVPSMLFMGSDGLTYPLEGDETTGRIYVDIAGGSGTVTSISAGTGILLTPDPIISTGTVALVTRLQPMATLTGNSLKVLRVNVGETAVEYATITTGLTVGTTTITSGTDTRVLFDNAGVLGEYTISGSGNVAMTTSPVFTTPNLGTPSTLVATNATGTAAGLSIGGTAAIGTTVTVADEATDTTCFVTFVTAATGNLGVKTNANMTFNSNTGVVTFASSVLTTTDINGGTIDNNIIGGATPAAATVTTLVSQTHTPAADGTYDLGSTTAAWNNLHLDTGATINFENGNSVITHSSAVLTVSTGDLRVTTAGTNTASVLTLDGTQTTANKTLTAPKIVSGGFIADANGNELIIFTTTASAVNEVTYANGSTGVNPKFTASGETNVGLDFQAKGTGTYRLLGTASQAAELRLYEDTDAGTNFTAFKVGTQAGDITYTLPTDDGDADQVLSTNGSGVLDWVTPAAGAASQIEVLTPGGAALPNTNYGAFNKKVGTNWVENVLDFDQTTSEAVYWSVPIMPGLTPASATLTVYWTADAGSGTFTVDVDTRSVANDEVWDATSTPSVANDTGTDTLIATGDVHVFTITLTTTGWAAEDLLQIKFSRDVGDTLSADARVFKAILKISP